MKSLRARLFAAIALAVIVAVSLSLVTAALSVHRSVQHEALKSLGRQADLLATQQRSAPTRASLGVFLATQEERLAILTVGQATLLLPQRGATALRAGRPAQGTVTVGRTRFLYAARLSGGKAIVLLRAASLQSQDWSPFEIGFLVAGAVGLVIAALAAFLLARTLSRPIRRVAEASRSLARGEHEATLAPEGPAEVVALAEAFNEMARDLAAAREAERSFLLSVSHELKTPLTAIRGHAEGLADGVLPPERVAEVISREAERLDRLVRDLLDLARLDAHAFRVRPLPLDLAEAVEEARVRFEATARGFGVELRVASAPNAPAVGDPDRVLQVVSNLIENALRATPAGGTVTVRAEAGTLTVEDTGPGLEPEDVARAFERFVLYDHYAESGRAVGTGLGLAIVRELTEAMGGSVTVESEPGRGARFIVSLPGEELAATRPARRGRRSRAR